jgi:RNA polymerase sigma-70 factor (ECF subfamily)
LDEGDDFGQLADSYRRELLAHCYRMLGSIDDAEDAVQETLLRAWHAYERFEGRASLRTWLNRIATNTCLRALETRRRRPLPSDLAGPSNPDQLLTKSPDILWLQPFPDALLPGEPDDPATIAANHESTRLAFVAALQHLPARQRAVLLLRDVLCWPARDVASLLDTTPAAVNSALQRARAQLAAVRPLEEADGELAEAEQRMFLERYVSAFRNADMTELAAVLQEDAALEMPPYPLWFAGRDAFIRFFSSRLSLGSNLMIQTRANCQPAFGYYRRGFDGRYHMHNIHVITFGRSGIARVTAFIDADLFAKFALPTDVDSP